MNTRLLRSRGYLKCLVFMFDLQPETAPFRRTTKVPIDITRRRDAQNRRSRLHVYFIERLTMLADMPVPPIGCVLVNSSPNVESQRSSRRRGLLRSVCRTSYIVLNIEDAARVSNQFHSFDCPATAEACGVGGVPICAAPFLQTSRGPASFLPAAPVAH